MKFEEFLIKLKQKKRKKDLEGGKAGYWGDDIDSKEDKQWSDKIWEQTLKKYNASN